MFPHHLSKPCMCFTGEGFDHGHLCRASCCRLYETIFEDLEAPYTVNHPQLSGVTFRVQDHYPVEGPPTSEGINWCSSDPEKVEVTSSLTGKAVPKYVLHNCIHFSKSITSLMQDLPLVVKDIVHNKKTVTIHCINFELLICCWHTPFITR